MTEKQKKFCEEYIITGNGTQAAINAGYSPRTAKVIAAQNLKKPEIKSYISAEMDQLRSEKIAQASEILQYLTAVMRGEAETEKVFMIQGEPVKINVKSDIKEQLKAAELLAKRYGLDKEDCSNSYSDQLQAVIDSINESMFQ